MLEIRKIGDKDKQDMVGWLRADITRHVFAFYDIQHEPEHTIVHAAFEDGRLKGYILTYTAIEPPSVILECEENIAKRLLNYTPDDHFIMHTPQTNQPIIESRFPSAKCSLENWMLVKKGQATFSKLELVHRLHTKEDASKLAALLATREDRPKGTIKKYTELVSRTPVFGVFINDELLSYAGSFIQLPQIWMIGGVYTHPSYRNRGYATLATSAVTEEALKQAETAALFVRSDNYSAIKTYEKIGYRKIGEKVWVDVGTGMKP